MPTDITHTIPGVSTTLTVADTACRVHGVDAALVIPR